MIKGTQEECKNMWIIQVISNTTWSNNISVNSVLIGNILKVQEW